MPQRLLDDAAFSTLQRLIHDLAGIHLGPHKRDLATGRLLHRLRALGMTSFAEYLPRISGLGADPQEQIAFVNSFTTNKTDFFREAHHFELLKTSVFPALRQGRRQPHRPRIWSAACSSGEEPYSIAMTALEAFAGQADCVQILASDIDTDVLARASRGVYDEERVACIPAPLRARYLLRGVGRSVGRSSLRPSVRALVSFAHINLAKRPWPVHGSFDAIFCRNVLIYFDRPTQKRIIDGFIGHLKPEGRLFLGHSESLFGSEHQLVAVGPTVYARKAAPVPIHRLGIGDLVASAEPMQLVTVLGSCVAVCLFDARAGVGGMSHFLVPTDAAGDQGLRAGARAIPALLERLHALGAQRGRITAKLAGAASVVPAIADAVPEANLRFAREALAATGIPIVGERVGGPRPIEAHFFTDGGQLRCRKLKAR